jgi:CelD/BcsL family acetyltransferase involved in cellulose biosynthesis
MQPLGAPMNDYHGVIARPGEGPSLAEPRPNCWAARA